MDPSLAFRAEAEKDAHVAAHLFSAGGREAALAHDQAVGQALELENAIVKIFAVHTEEQILVGIQFS